MPERWRLAQFGGRENTEFGLFRISLGVRAGTKYWHEQALTRNVLLFPITLFELVRPEFPHTLILVQKSRYYGERTDDFRAAEPGLIKKSGKVCASTSIRVACSLFSCQFIATQYFDWSTHHDPSRQLPHPVRHR